MHDPPTTAPRRRKGGGEKDSSRRSEARQQRQQRGGRGDRGGRIVRLGRVPAGWSSFFTTARSSSSLLLVSPAPVVLLPPPPSEDDLLPVHYFHCHHKWSTRPCYAAHHPRLTRESDGSIIAHCAVSERHALTTPRLITSSLSWNTSKGSRLRGCGD
jgi:hypothetical protein